MSAVEGSIISHSLYPVFKRILEIGERIANKNQNSRTTEKTSVEEHHVIGFDLKPNSPRFGRRHLGLFKSFGARVCAVVVLV